jgi:anti-sigma regulatory factor (Ser/Thr protein kinase)
MPSQLVCRPEQDLPVAVLRVDGVLDQLTSDALRRAVARSLSAAPDALVIDVTGMHIADALGLRGLREVLRQTAEWPAAPVVLCGAGAETAAMINSSPDCVAVTTADDCDKAVTDLAAAPRPQRIRMRLPPVPDACRQVRQLVNQACAAWHRREAAAVAALIATELVANVVRHAHTTMEFTMGLRDGGMWLTVRDGSRRMPRPADPGVTDAGGRGLQLVRELTESWGVLPVPDGKVVWTRLAADGL